MFVTSETFFVSILDSELVFNHFSLHTGFFMHIKAYFLSCLLVKFLLVAYTCTAYFYLFYKLFFLYLIDS